MITGASSGLGLEIGNALEVKGVRVINLSRSKTKFQDIYIDLAEDKTISNAVKVIKSQHKDIDLLILNAGIMPLAEMGKINFDIDKSFLVNVTGSIKLVNGLIDILRKNNADIAVVGSTVAFNNSGGKGMVYTCTKQAVLSFIRSLQVEVKYEDVRVIGFHPGGFTSNLRGKGIIKKEGMKVRNLADLLITLLTLPRNMEVSEIIINRKSKTK